MAKLLIINLSLLFIDSKKYRRQELFKFLIIYAMPTVFLLESVLKSDINNITN